MNGRSIRTLLVDDHAVVRMGLIAASAGHPDVEVVAEAENSDQAISAYRQHVPDVVVLDLRMPGTGGIETLHRMREEFGTVRVLIFSNYSSGEQALQAFDAGASGYVVKNMPVDWLFEGIRKIHAGEHYMPAEIAARVSRCVVSRLSNRELEVLSLVAQGLSNKEIAAALHLVEGTVKVHLTSILSKLRVSGRTQAVLAGLRMGIIHVD